MNQAASTSQDAANTATAGNTKTITISKVAYKQFGLDNVHILLPG